MRCLVLSVVLFAAAACGDDGAAAPPPKRGPAKKAAAAPGKPATAPKVSSYNKVADDLRHQFTDRDFIPDSAGDQNRDPFRSFIVRNAADEGEELGEKTDVCDPAKWKAPTYAVQSLRLMGIVLKGTQSYAQFRDSGGFGHIVRRGYCLGKEKAVIDTIGTGFVRLEVTPEAPQGAVAPPPQKRSIALYPEELTLEDAAGDLGLIEQSQAETEGAQPAPAPSGGN